MNILQNFWNLCRIMYCKIFSSPANSYNFHEASRWKAQSSRRIGNFARHLLMHECVSSDERSKNEIEYYANAKWLCKSSLRGNVACDIGTRASCRRALNLFPLLREKTGPRERMPRKYRHLQRMSPLERAGPDYFIRRRYFVSSTCRVFLHVSWPRYARERAN